MHAVVLPQPLHERERETFTFTFNVHPTGLMDVPGYVNPDELIDVPIRFVCR